MSKCWGRRELFRALKVLIRKRSDSSAKLYLNVPKKFGKAHRRNKFKRWVRAAFRQFSFSGLDFRVSPQRKELRWSDVRESINALALALK